MNTTFLTMQKRSRCLHFSFLFILVNLLSNALFAQTFDKGFELVSGTLPTLNQDVNADGTKESFKVNDTGGYTTGNLSPFALWGQSQGGYLVNSQFNAHSGSNFLLIKGDDNCFGLLSSCSFTASKTYTIKFWAAAWSASGAVTLSPSLDLFISGLNSKVWVVGTSQGQSLVNSFYSGATSGSEAGWASNTTNFFTLGSGWTPATSSGSGTTLQWKEYSFTFTAPASAASIKMWVSKFGGNDGYLALDDVSCEEVVSTPTCCTTEIYAQPGLESSETMNTKFPNATITATNNSASFADHVITGGWNFDDGAASGKSMYRIRDASRASEGSEFIYLPFINGTNAYNYCIQPKPKITYSSAASCATAQMVIGRRYVLAYDYVPFNQDVPNGGTGQQKPVADMFNAGGSQIGTYTAYNASGTAIPYETAVSWTDIKTSWKRAYFSVVIPSGSDSFYASAMKDGSSGMLIDNLSLKELTMTAGGIGTVSCDATQTKRVFTLNPTSNVGGVPNLKYNVTAPVGYTIAPTQGTYGQATTFTLTKTSGSAIGTGSLSITLTDEVNSNCSITETVADPNCAPVCIKPNAGTDQAPACSGSTPITTANLAATAVSGGTWTQVGTTPNTATITTPSSATSTVTGLVPGVYQFIWATSATCSDTVQVVISNCTACTDNKLLNPSFEDNSL